MMDTIQRTRAFQRQEHMARRGDAQDKIFLIEEGWACSYTLLPDGRRQITALYLPGDYCEPQWLLSGRTEAPIATLTELRVKELSVATLHAQREEGVMKVFAALLKSYDRQRAWLVSLGRKSAIERVADLFTELYARLDERGRVIAGRCMVPLTQQDIADAVGLTPVHVNRVLSSLRAQGLAYFSGKTLEIPDLKALAALGIAQIAEVA